MLPTKERLAFSNWILGLSDPIDEQSKIRAYELYENSILENIEKMPETTVDEIIDKYIEMNIAHPFIEGNGRSTRIWLDVILKNRIGKCVNWQKIDKKSYLVAMSKSPVNSKPIKKLIINALTDKINDREIFTKGIDYSYYYETIDD